MRAGLRGLGGELRGDDRVADDGDALPGQAGDPGGILRHPLGHRHDALDARIEQPDGQKAEPALDGPAPRHGGGEVGAQPQHQGRSRASQAPRQDRRAPGPVLGGEECRGASLPQIAGQRRDRELGMAGGEANLADLGWQTFQVRALGLHQHQLHRLTQVHEAADQVDQHTLHPPGAREGGKDGEGWPIASHRGAQGWTAVALAAARDDVPDLGVTSMPPCHCPGAAWHLFRSGATRTGCSCARRPNIAARRRSTGCRRSRWQTTAQAPRPRSASSASIATTPGAGTPGRRTLRTRRLAPDGTRRAGVCCPFARGLTSSDRGKRRRSADALRISCSG